MNRHLQAISYLAPLILFFIAGAIVVHDGPGSYKALAPSIPPQPHWIRTGGPPGGLGYDVRMRPGATDTMYVTDAYAGVHMSYDGGATWFPSNSGIDARSGESGDAIPIFCLTIDPHDPDIVWAGTQYFRGIYRSADAGRNWQKRVNGIIESEVTFRGVTIDPRSSDIVYAAGEISSWIWNGGKDSLGKEFDMTRGVVYKTIDAGLNWTRVWEGANLARYIWIDPHHPDTVYVSTGIFDREAANSNPIASDPGGVGIIKSTDGGATWNPVNTGIGNLYLGTLYMHPEDPNLLLAGAGNNAYPDSGGVYRTTNGGDTWSLVLGGEIIIESVEFSETSPHIAYAAGESGVFFSEDYGATWGQVAGFPDGWGAPGVRAGFPIDFQVDPGNPLRIFANNYGGGNFLSEDGGFTWELASQGYTGAQTRGLAVDPHDPSRVFVAARTGVWLTYDAGASYKGLSYPPAYALEWQAVAIDPEDPGHVLAASTWFQHLWRTQNGGISWDVAGPNVGTNKGFSAFAFAPENPELVYAGTSAYYSAGGFDFNLAAAGVYASTTRGATWSPANDGLSSDANVADLAVLRADPHVVYAATGNKGLLKTDDRGASWRRLRIEVENEAVMSVELHPNNPDVVYAGLWSNGVWRSEDGGSSWTQLAAGLPAEASIRDIEFHPHDPDQVFAADIFSGVYQRIADGPWVQLNDSLRTRYVNDLEFAADGRYLYAATEGEGVFRLDLAEVPSVKLEARVLLEGPYAGEGLMQAPGLFRDALPLLQPYGEWFFDGSNVDYDGLEYASPLPTGALDWVVLSLRQAPEPETVIARRAAILRDDGQVLDVGGEPELTFEGVLEGSYFVVVCHRNHACVMSADALFLGTEVAGSVNFATEIAAAYAGTGAPMKALDGTYFGMFAADGDANGIIDGVDLDRTLTQTGLGREGYWTGDYNMDGSVDALDANLWLAGYASGVGSGMP